MTLRRVRITQGAAAAHPRTTFGQAVGAAFGLERDINRIGARREYMAQAEWNRHRDAERRAGRPLSASRDMHGLQWAEDAMPTGTMAVAGFDTQYANEREYRRTMAVRGTPVLEFGRDYEQNLERQRAENPDRWRGFEDRRAFDARIDRELRARASQYDDVIENSDHPMLARLTGGVGANFVDPVNITVNAATGGVGEGYGLLARLGMQAGVSAGTEALLSPLRLAEARAIGGPEYGLEQAQNDIISSAIFGAGGELVGIGIGRILDRGRAMPANMRAQAAENIAEPVARQTVRDINDALDLDVIIGGNDPELRDVLADEMAVSQLATLYGHPVRAPDIPEIKPFEEALVPGERLDDGVNDMVHAPAVEVAPDEFMAAPQLFDDAPRPKEILPLTDQPLTAMAMPRDPRQIFSGWFNPRNIETDARAMQYKAGGDGAGVTERLRDVREWNPSRAGIVFVFQRNNGELIIADGHQRLGLAKRLFQDNPDIRMQGYLFREADGWTVPEMRTEAALKNMAEGSGSAIDAARILRERGTDPSLPMGGAMMRAARGLMPLSDEAFGMVVNASEAIKDDVIRDAAIVGRVAASTPELHAGMLKVVRDGEYGSAAQVEVAVSRLMAHHWAKDGASQSELFDTGLLVPALFHERNKAVVAAVSALNNDKRAFSTLVNNASMYELYGNVIVREASEAQAQAAHGAAMVVERLAELPGPVADAMGKAAQAIADGVAPAKAVADVVAEVKAVVAGRDAGHVLLEALAPSDGERAALALAERDRPLIDEQATDLDLPEAYRDDLTMDMFGDLAPAQKQVDVGPDTISQLSGCAGI